MLARILHPVRWLALLALVTCSNTVMAEENLERALGFLQEGNADAAIIEFKNAIQADPDNAEARALLGELYLRVNDPASAVKELQRARELDPGNQRTRLMLAEGRLMIGEYQLVIDDVPAEQQMGDEIGAGLLAARGQALVALGQFEEARQTLERVTAERPVASAYAGLARMALLQGDTSAAKRYLEDGINRYPDVSGLKLLRGELQMQERKFEDARSTFDEVSKENPRSLPAAIGVARAELALGRLESARVVLDDLQRRYPRVLAIYLLRSVAALQSRDYAAAQQDANTVLAHEDDNPPALYVAGASSYALQQYEQARRALTRYNAEVPSDPAGRKLLAATMVRMGDVEAAKELLGDDPAASDPEYLALQSTASVLSGDVSSGMRYLEDALVHSPSDARLRAQLGLLRILSGDLVRGADELEQALALDPALADNPEFDRAELALIRGYLENGRFEEALAAIRDWQAEHPDEAAGFVMEGVALARSGDEEGGRAAFLKAMQLKPGAPDAGANLAMLDLRANRLDKAQEVLESVLAHNPGELRALLLLAQISVIGGDREQARSRLEEAVAVHPANAQARIMLSRLHLVSGEPEKALAVVAPVLSADPGNMTALEIKALAAMSAGQIAEGIAAYEQIAAKDPNAAQPRYALSQAYEAAGELEKARATAEAALAIQPDHVPTRVQLAKLAVASGVVDTAEREIAALEDALPDAPEIAELRGALLMLQGQPQQAMVKFRQARQAADAPHLAIAEARASAASGDLATSVKILESWIAEHPEDTAVRLELNRYYLGTARAEDARANLRQIISYDPGSWVAHNDLAWLLYQDGDYAAAKPAAERAFELQPDNPAVMDTLGVILLKTGETDRAVALLRRANEMVPDDPATLFHLAWAYAESGRKAEALDLLAKLLDENVDFPERNEAEALLSGLRG